MALKDDSVVERYKIVRSYIEHEDQLIADRISRTLLSHGFLIASFALLIQARIAAIAQCMAREAGCVTREAVIERETLTNAMQDSPEKLNAKLELLRSKQQLIPETLVTVLGWTDVVLPIIAIVGLVITLSACWGVILAQDSIGRLKNKISNEDIAALGLPGLVSGTPSDPRKRDPSITLLMIGLLVMWCGMLMASIGLAKGSGALSRLAGLLFG